jgi:hypothetical protein
MTLFQNLILFTNHYGNLQEMLEMASFLKYVGLYLTSEWGRFYVGHPVYIYVYIRFGIWKQGRVACIDRWMCVYRYVDTGVLPL